MEINIYAPVDCEVKNISKCSDEAFANKLLGEGILIIPKNDNFYLPFDSALCSMIFDTKHAYGFKIKEKIDVLIHCGIDTVQLNGQGFLSKTNVDNNLLKGDPIFDVDLNLLKEKNLKNETLIVFDLNNIKSINFLNLKEKNFSKGELICTVQIDLKEENDKAILSKYNKIATELVDLVGGEKNYNKVYNCMTRLRFNIIDKKIVKEDKIKKCDLVKGINWAGNELQIIIGGEVYKVKDEIEKNFNEVNNIKKTNIKTKDKILSFISGVIIPTIPILLAAGLLMAIKAILIQTKVIQDIKGFDQIKNATIFSAFMYIIAEVGIGMLGIFLCITTVKYLKGNVIVGAMVGVAIASPYLMWGVTFTIADWGFIKIRLMGYYNSIIPQIAAGAIYVYVDRWVKSWMPSFLDICFRTAISFLIVMICIMFILGPILNIIEGLVGVAVKWVGYLPYGIGTMVFAMLWQPLVLTGIHVPIIMAIMQNLPNPLYIVFTFGVFGQVGAALCVGNKTNNFQTKEIAYSSLPAGIIGITEPIIYGVNLPRFIPFLTGCLGAGVSGLITGILGINAYNPGGMGILAVTRVIYGGIYQIGLFFLGVALSVGFSYLFTFFMYKERISENFAIKKINKLFIKYLIAKNKLTKNHAFELLKKLNTEFNISKKDIKNIEKAFSLNSKMICKISKREKYLENKKEKIYLKLEKNKNNIILKNKLNEKILELNNDKKIKDFINKKNDYNLIFENKKNELNKIQNNILNKIDNNISNYLKNDNYLRLIENNYYNAIHSLDIYFNICDKKENIFLLKKGLKNEIS